MNVAFKKKLVAALTKEFIKPFAKDPGWYYDADIVEARQKGEQVAWAILNTKTDKLVGWTYPHLFGSSTGAAGQAVGKHEVVVPVRVIPIKHKFVKR